MIAGLKAVKKIAEYMPIIVVMVLESRELNVNMIVIIIWYFHIQWAVPKNSTALMYTRLLPETLFVIAFC